MKYKKIIAPLLAVLFLSACKTVPPANFPEETTATEAVTTVTEITTIGEIPLAEAAKPIDLGEVVPINKSASVQAKALLGYIADNYGEKTIAGQYAADSDNKELELIHEVTGRYPALRLADIGEDGESAVASSLRWEERGGIVGLMWHWKAPFDGGLYAKETGFDLGKAVYSGKENLALKTPEELKKLESEKKISPECLALLQDIDEISAELKKLSDAGVPVLWRPLHEAAGGWFWWGSAGKEPYYWLWDLLYERQTVYHKLDNLIWVWNAGDPDWYKPCDIAAADIYSDDGSPYKSEFDRLSKVGTGRKPVALSECGTIPDSDLMAKEGAVWSFFGLWYGEYVMDKFGIYNTQFTSKEQLIKTYNSEGTITLDELPVI